MTDDKKRELLARQLCEFDGGDPDTSLGGDKQNWLWHEYVNQAEGLMASDFVLTTVDGGLRKEMARISLQGYEKGRADAFREAADHIERQAAKLLWLCPSCVAPSHDAVGADARRSIAEIVRGFKAGLSYDGRIEEIARAIEAE